MNINFPITFNFLILQYMYMYVGPMYIYILHVYMYKYSATCTCIYDVVCVIFFNYMIFVYSLSLQFLLISMASVISPRLSGLPSPQDIPALLLILTYVFIPMVQ